MPSAAASESFHVIKALVLLAGANSALADESPLAISCADTAGEGAAADDASASPPSETLLLLLAWVADIARNQSVC